MSDSMATRTNEEIAHLIMRHARLAPQTVEFAKAAFAAATRRAPDHPYPVPDLVLSAWLDIADADGARGALHVVSGGGERVVLDTLGGIVRRGRKGRRGSTLGFLGVMPRHREEVGQAHREFMAMHYPSATGPSVRAQLTAAAAGLTKETRQAYRPSVPAAQLPRALQPAE